ncbi:MAG: hypothetical protein JSR47_22490 [Proteobacteria bacterium]|nr:hypothetical protein [Pseudomonadota bacterium]
MLSRRTLIMASLAGLLVVGLAGLSRFAHWYKAWMDAFGPGWHATAWPFLRDGYGPGRAWRNGETTVYVRPKFGLCANCDTGVVDDSEVDQVTDVDLLDEKFTAVGPGARIRVTDLSGRARLYNVATPEGSRTAWAIAVNYQCDLVVALAIGRLDDAAVREETREFLESNTVQIWLNQQLERR